MRVVIIGAGGHGQVVADILLRMREHSGSVEPIGYLDDNPLLVGRKFLGLPVLGPLANITDIAHDAIIVAIGNNKIRYQVFNQLNANGERFFTAIHPSAVIAPDVKIGSGTMICAGVVINTGSDIGANVILNTSCSVDHHNKIGDHVHIAPGARLAGEVVIGTGVLVGIGAIVTPGTRIGDWSIIGAGSIVHHHIPDNTKVTGSSARPIEKKSSD